MDEDRHLSTKYQYISNQLQKIIHSANGLLIDL